MADPGLSISFETLKELGSYIWLLIVAAFTWIWRRLNKDIKEAKDKADAALPRLEFEGYAGRMEQARQEQREEIKEYRGDMKELGNKLDKHFQDDAANFRAIINATNDQTRIILDKLDKKEDKK